MQVERVGTMKNVLQRRGAQSCTYFPLAPNQQTAFSDNHGLAVRVDGKIARVNWDNGIVLSEEEFPLFVALLRAWPRYCPYETVFTLLPSTNLEAGLPSAVLAPTDLFQARLASLHLLLSRIQPKLEKLELQIVAILDEGLLLSRSSPRYPEKVRSFARYREEKCRGAFRKKQT